MGLFALSLWRHEFFCASMVTMLARLGFGKKPNASAPAAPGKRTNGKPVASQANAEKALTNALQNLAYHHVQRYANAIKANARANAAAANAAKNAADNPNPNNVKKAETTAAAATHAAANTAAAEEAARAVAKAATASQANAAAEAALQAEAAATNAVAVLITRVNDGNFNLKNNTGKVTGFNNGKYSSEYSKLPTNANKKALNNAVAGHKNLLRL
jgi:hypothetical protein